MGRRRGYDQDPVINTYLENYRRAAAALLLAVGFLAAWVFCVFMSSSADAQPQVLQIVPNAFTAFFGWAGVITLLGAGLLYAYAWYYPHLMARRYR